MPLDTVYSNGSQRVPRIFIRKWILKVYQPTTYWQFFMPFLPVLGLRPEDEEEMEDLRSVLYVNDVQRGRDLASASESG